MNSNKNASIFTGYSKSSYKSVSGISESFPLNTRSSQTCRMAATSVIFSKLDKNLFELDTPWALTKMRESHNQFNLYGIPPQETLTATKSDQPIISTQIPKISEAEIIWRRSVSTNLSCDLINKKIHKIFKDNGIVDISLHSPFKIEGRYFSSNHEMATFLIRIYQNKDNDSVHIIEFTRNSGRGEAIFQKFLSTIINGLSEEIIKTEISNNLDPWIPISLPLPLLPAFPDLLSLPWNSDNESATSEMTDLEYINDLILQCEDGFAHEIEIAAPTLARESEKSHILQQLYQIDNIVTRFLKIFEKSCDILLVRSLLVVLSNMLSSKPQFYCEVCSKYNLCENLKNLQIRWSSDIKPFSECDITIDKSSEINRICEQIHLLN